MELMLKAEELRRKEVRYGEAESSGGGRMFAYEGLPDSIPQKELERLLQTTGNAFDHAISLIKRDIKF